ncbi:MAG: RNA polymerase [Flammeovirgaceae bacterium]|nr:RNA polymerase [Flammeovirgaceae bacterium]MBE63407.1 RNA polymerase [Flammeovirgaceae bacterium]MBR09083.1 RNA polymerase [Rickettsiales bacterium]HCX24953.1 RNA polymerase [Cytophagales bacterium]
MSDLFFKSFVTENMGIISHICRAYASDEEELKDLIQEVTIQLWKSHQKFQGNSKISTWVYRVTLNVCLAINRKRKLVTEPIKSVDFAEDIDQTEKEQIDLLYKAIKQLSDSDRAIILLYLEKKSYQEISEILGMTVSNVGVKVNRLKDKLKTMING